MKILPISLAATSLLVAACAPVAVSDPEAPSPGASQCRADQYKRYVGRNRSGLPPRPADEVWRVTCTTCPVTMDFNPGRLNILFEESTGVIREVKCG